MQDHKDNPYPSHLSLNDGWRVTGSSPDGTETISIPATVPGHIHVDLLRDGRIPDFFWRDQAEACQWVEKWTWLYQAGFELPDSFDRRWAVLEFGGLDTYAEISLNGERLGSTDNMFVPHRFDVSDAPAAPEVCGAPPGPCRLRAGQNRLDVRFTPYAAHLQGKRMDYHAAFNTVERVHIRRMQCTFAWDWVHRFVSAGIWRPVSLFSYRGARLSDLFVRTQAVDAAGASLRVTVEVEQRIPGPLLAHVEILAPSGAMAAAGRIAIRDARGDLELAVAAPELWFPNGYGAQPLYTCRVSLYAADGTQLDAKTVRFGIRTVRVEELADRPGSPEMALTMDLRRRYPRQDRHNGEAPGRSFTLVVNGQRIFCKGGNWVPCDPFPSRVAPGKYDRLIRLAREANMNLLRCWGGGIYEPDSFWDACDRHGVMVTQDFAMACAAYPEDDPEFRAKLRTEADAAIRMLRNHPSLAWWTGDNENCMFSNEDDLSASGRLLADTVTGLLCRELDPSRPFFPTSPCRGRPNISITMGDSHVTAYPFMKKDLDGLADYQENIARATSRFMSESVTMGAPPMRSLLKFMTPEDVASPDAAMWEYHTKANPYLDLSLYELLRMTTEKLFGPFSTIEQKVGAMGYVQYEWVRLALEAARRHKWYCSGLQFWMYNDCWPASGLSLVDYYGFPKAAYYAFRRAARPLIASLEPTPDAYRVWVCNDAPQGVRGELDLRVHPWQGGADWRRASAFDVPANTSRCVLSIPRRQLEGRLSPDHVLVCDLAAPGAADRAFYHPGLPSRMNLLPARLQVTQENQGDGGRLIIASDRYARVVTLDADLDFSDNYFDLLPGEERVVQYSAPVPGGVPAVIPVTCWNRES